MGSPIVALSGSSTVFSPFTTETFNLGAEGETRTPTSYKTGRSERPASTISPLLQSAYTHFTRVITEYRCGGGQNRTAANDPDFQSGALPTELLPRGDIHLIRATWSK